MSRLFTFGCSFTKYNWMTWADIVGQLFDTHENYGVSGVGNMYIFNSFIHAITQHNINEKDTVMIMWTNVTREDRFLNGKWQTPGNLATQTFYNDNFLSNYFDIEGCYQRDIPAIHATRLILDKIGCKYVMMSMVDIHNSDQYTVVDESEVSGIKSLLTKFDSTLNLIKPSVHKIIFNYEYSSRPVTGFRKRPDNHPLPLEHLEYVERILPEFQLNDVIKNNVYKNQADTLNTLKKLG